MHKITGAECVQYMQYPDGHALGGQQKGTVSVLLCKTMAGVMALCRSARRRAVVLWLALWPLSRAARRLAKAVFLIHRKGGQRGLACAHGGLGAS